MSKETRVIGRIAAITVYPVKSMAGQSLNTSKVGWQGLEHDRQYAFQRLDDRSGLPWLSARDFPGMLLYKPTIDDLKHIYVAMPMGASLPVDADLLLSELSSASGFPLRLTQLWRGTFDAAPISLLSTGSIAAAEAMIGRSLEAERFRANILIDSMTGESFPEDRWVGRIVKIGDTPTALRIRIDRKDKRCRIVNFAPDNAEENPTILEEVVRQRKNNLGVYGNTVFPGLIQVGDRVQLLGE